MGLKSSNWSCLKARFEGYTFCFAKKLVRPSTETQQSHERARKKNVSSRFLTILKVLWSAMQAWLTVYKRQDHKIAKMKNEPSVD
jgi:hypothetical protein